ncbi:phage capsid scaffolding (GPO) serine peptidase family protein, partial [Escherichia coli 1-392-07_S4_C1]
FSLTPCSGRFLTTKALCISLLRFAIMTEEPVRGAKTMANEKKTSRKKFRVAVSGSTVDGREISQVHLREAAENFNPDVYAARVNVEHYLSPCPSSEFSAMGDV